MFKKGDYIDGIGIVEGNHVGAPWPVDIKGNFMYGAVQVRTPKGNSIYCDILTGIPLSDTEIQDRQNPNSTSLEINLYKSMT